VAGVSISSNNSPDWVVIEDAILYLHTSRYAGHFFCFECWVFLPANNFTNDKVTGKYGKNGYVAPRRFCISCGANGGTYHPYDDTIMQGQMAYYYRHLQ
jgi:hypothetical protein